MCPSAKLKDEGRWKKLKFDAFHEHVGPGLEREGSPWQCRRSGNRSDPQRIKEFDSNANESTEGRRRWARKTRLGVGEQGVSIQAHQGRRRDEVTRREGGTEKGRGD